MSIKKQKGLILVSTVGMITIFTLLIVSLMQALLFYIKVSQEVLVNDKKLLNLETIAKKILNLNPRTACEFTNMDMEEIAEVLPQTKECSLLEDKETYYYLLSDLGIFPCLTVVENGELMITHHWLISVAARSSKNMIQLRIAKPTKFVRCVGSQARPIEKGVISWRYITYK